MLEQENNNNNADGQPKADSVRLSALLGALSELKKNWDSFHKPDFVNEDESIRWALDELSDEAHTHLLAPR